MKTKQQRMEKRKSGADCRKVVLWDDNVLRYVIFACQPASQVCQPANVCTVKAPYPN